MKRDLMFILFLMVLFSLSSNCAFAEIYKWVDEQGKVHFGDSKYQSDNSQRVDLKINSFTSVSYGELDSDAGGEVIMYSTSWCGYCKKARRYFQEQNTVFKEFDVEKNLAAKREYKRLGGKGVPVIIVGKKRMNGFSKAGFEKLYR